MSIRAYRIITKQLESEPSFNLSRDEELIEYFNSKNGYIEQSDTEVSVQVQAIKSALDRFKWEKPIDYRKNHLKADIKGLEDEDWIDYECI